MFQKDNRQKRVFRPLKLLRDTFDSICFIFLKLLNNPLTRNKKNQSVYNVWKSDEEIPQITVSQISPTFLETEAIVWEVRSNTRNGDLGFASQLQLFLVFGNRRKSSSYLNCHVKCSLFTSVFQYLIQQLANWAL